MASPATPRKARSWAPGRGGIAPLRPEAFRAHELLMHRIREHQVPGSRAEGSFLWSSRSLVDRVFGSGDFESLPAPSCFASTARTHASSRRVTPPLGSFFPLSQAETRVGVTPIAFASWLFAPGEVVAARNLWMRSGSNGITGSFWLFRAKIASGESERPDVASACNPAWAIWATVPGSANRRARVSSYPAATANAYR